MKYCIAIYFLLIPLFALSQKTKETLVDSLQSELARAKEDTNKVHLLDKLSYLYSTVNPGKGMALANEELILSEKLGWKKGKAMANSDIGINYESVFNHVQALDFAQKSQKLYEELGDKEGVARTMANIGIIYLHKSEYSKTLEYEFKALKSYEESGEIKKKSIILETIGIVYSEQKNYAKAMEYYKAALRINEESGDKESVARNLGNIGTIFGATGDDANALKHHILALKTNQVNGNKQGLQVNLENIGNVYAHMHDYSHALKYQLHALKISEEIGDKSSIAINLGNIGETYFEMSADTAGHGRQVPKNKAQNQALAIMNLEKAVAICSEINFYGPELEFMQYLTEVYSSTGNYKKAFENFKEYSRLKDSVFSGQNKLQITKLETEREIEIRNRDLLIKDKQIQIKKLEVAQERSEHILYFVSVALFAVIAGVGLKRIYDIKTANTMLQISKDSAEKKLVHNEFRLKQAQEIAHLGSWELNFETGIARWSEETCRICGLLPGEAVQSHEAWLSFIHPDDLDHVLETMEKGKLNLSNISYYHRIVRRDGTIRHLYSQAQYEFDDKGNATGLYGVVHDITEMKQNEEDIRLSNERFLLVNKASRDAIMDWDITRDTTIWGNGFCDIFGYKPNEYHNHLLSDNIHPDDRNEIVTKLQKVMDDPTSNLLSAEFRFLKANRDIAYVQLRSIFIRDEKGKPTRAVASVMDITGLVEKNRALENQNAALREIAWMQSHVIRAPLATLMGLVELLKYKDEYGVSERDLIDKIQAAAEVMDKVIHDIVNKAEAVEYRVKDS